MNISRSIPKLPESNIITIKQRIPNLNSQRIAPQVARKTFLKSEQSVTGYKNVDHHLTDSGFESFERFSVMKYKKIKSEASVIKNESKLVPFDVSFVGGKFNLNVFEVRNEVGSLYK